FDELIDRGLKDVKLVVSDGHKGIQWSEPLRVYNELSNINSWREVYEKDEAALRPSIQDISSS
ncbi:MAG: transposase, partial [Methanothrix sp.]